ncbi:universal stress protein [Nostocoides sp.]|uniref:universal stress protein n=1 Tax=Nostocoides sp. TaxID=1917966 RepID=UPI002CB4E3F1|nr:universal stress protein [Tetrasphaera sp.]
MTIVVAYTPDPAGSAALDLAVREARIRGEKLIVVNATKGEALVDARFASSGDLGQVDAQLSGLEHEIKQPVGVDVAELVLDEVRESGASLLVVGLRHRSPVGKLIMGSVSQRLLLDAPVPVFAVPAGRHTAS